MKNKNIIIITALMLSIMFLAYNGFANIPAPPVNQLLGMPDTTIYVMEEADCRACHDGNETSNPDRHHLIYGSTIITGECLYSNEVTPCLSDADCPESFNFCVGETAASDIDANKDGINDTDYGCLSCHDEETNDGVTNFLVERDCLVCHVQRPFESTVHHLSATAQGTQDKKGKCTPCHGTLVDDFGDNATIPTYDPSLVTPAPHEVAYKCVQAGVSTGESCTTNADCTAPATCEEVQLPGGCAYCHNSGTDLASGVSVYTSKDTHHNSGVDKFRNGDPNYNGCQMCHPLDPWTTTIRECEQCHGMESLHNIKADSPKCDEGGGNCECDGDVVIGGELYGYGHVGIDNPGVESDCWGCHGFITSADTAPYSGPITPYISSASQQLIIAGTDTTITLNGSSFTNLLGTVEWKSTIQLTSKDGTVIELTPDPINTCSCSIVIPGTTAPGTYLLTAVKDNGTAISNPLPISIKPPVIIESSTIRSTCGGCKGELTITGSGFGDTPPAGTESQINVMQNDVPLHIRYWMDTFILATGAVCDSSEITVNGLFGSATK